MEFMEVLKKRQSIRRYKEGQIPKADLLKIIEAAGLAPSGKNIQNWHFVVVTDQAVKEKIAGIVTEKNRVVSDKMDLVDPEKGSRFRKFSRSPLIPRPRQRLVSGAPGAPRPRRGCRL